MKNITHPEWIPDWRYPDQYPNINGTTRRNWAWQFLRRNPEYQQAYSQLLQHPHAKFRAWTERGCIELKHLSVVGQEEDYSDFEGKFHSTRIKFGTGFSLYDPSYGDHELRCLAIPNEYSVFVGVPKIRNITLQYLTTQVPVLIDLTIPIEPQLETIKAALKPFSQRVYGKPRRSATQISKLQSYLRVLDARLCKVTFSEIGNLLYPIYTNEHPEYLRKKHAQIAHKVAKKIMEIDYKLLLYNALPETRWMPLQG